jgi:hypothetical protein
MPGGLPAHSQKINSSQPELNNNWTKVSYKRGRSTQEETEREAKHAKESQHWLSQTSTSNCYTALLEEEMEDQQHKASPENTPKSPPVYKTDVKNISSLIQLLEQIAKQQYEVKTLAHNQVKVQPKTSELTFKCRPFETMAARAGQSLFKCPLLLCQFLSERLNCFKQCV